MMLLQRRYRCLTLVYVLLLVLGNLGINFSLNLTTVKGQSGNDAHSELLSSSIYLPKISKPTPKGTIPDPQTGETAAWPMAGANPQRTSWTPEEVRGKLTPLWYKPFEPYISQKVQVIAAYNTLYIATSRGLYAVDAETGADRWVYPTELPLGHSPTVADGVVYVGGFDRKLHAIDAMTGAGLWTFEAGAGFHTNPLVVDDKVYAGNRDGFFYAIYVRGAQAGQIAWKFQTGGPILYSAAYRDGVVYFAAQDSHAYALNAQTGSLVWKSPKLPGAGFRSWWPVVYGDRVVFAGSNNYRTAGFGSPKVAMRQTTEVFPNHKTDPVGTPIGPLGNEPGDWAEGTVTIDATAIQTFLTQKPWHRTIFVLDRATGTEREVAPVLWTGNDGVGNRYPPVVGSDGVLYQQNSYLSHPAIPGGQVSGWKIGSPYISVVSSDWAAMDEPHAYSAGGNLIYWNLCCDRQAGAFDITVPNAKWAEAKLAGKQSGSQDGSREWTYFGYNTGTGNSLSDMLPGFRQYYTPDAGTPAETSPYGSFGRNGVYGWHGDTNPPIPYRGKVFMLRSNTLIAFGNSSQAPVAAPMAQTVATSDPAAAASGSQSLQTRLTEEIEKMIAAGHLRPGYHSHGIFDLRAQTGCGDDLSSYWHQPADTLYTLLRALPHLSPDLQARVKEYLQSEYSTYPPYAVNHVGWKDGAAREIFDLPKDVEADLQSHPAQSKIFGFVWQRDPYAFYALWKYAQAFGDAPKILQAGQQAFLETFSQQPSDDVLQKMPHIHNAYIAGYWGYLELEKLASAPESTNVRQELERLLQLRASTFTQNSAYADLGKTDDGVYCRTLNIASNFMYLVPELASYLRTHAQDKVQAALVEYTTVAPYWFVSFAEEGFAENYTAPLYDGYALFMAKALILQEPGEELEKYLDVPGFARGDLFYIQKLVATLENYAAVSEEPNSIASQ